jgi:ankyrin repeat protein
MELMELLLQHGANVNDQVAGTLTYSLRVSRAPSANEGRTALHIAALDGRTELVRYLLSKGANPEIKDAGGLKPIDLAGSDAKGGNLPEGKTVDPATVAEIRGLLEKAAASRK